MVRIQPDPPIVWRKYPGKSLYGGIAQLGEHLLCKQGVVGSIPSASTTIFNAKCLVRKRTEDLALAIEPVRVMQVTVSAVVL